MSWTGDDVRHCDRTDEDPRGDPPERVMDDDPDEEQEPSEYLKLAIANLRAQRAAIAHPLTALELIEYLECGPKPGYLANARAQRAAVTDPDKRRQLEECLREAERATWEQVAHE